MEIKYEVFVCGQREATLYTEEEVIEYFNNWINEEELIEDDGARVIYDVLNTLTIKKIGMA